MADNEILGALRQVEAVAKNCRQDLRKERLRLMTQIAGESEDENVIRILEEGSLIFSPNWSALVYTLFDLYFILFLSSFHQLFSLVSDDELEDKSFDANQTIDEDDLDYADVNDAHEDDELLEIDKTKALLVSLIANKEFAFQSQFLSMLEICQVKIKIRYLYKIR